MVPARRRTTRSSRARRYSTGSVTPLMQGPASTSITARSRAHDPILDPRHRVQQLGPQAGIGARSQQHADEQGAGQQRDREQAGQESGVASSGRGLRRKVAHRISPRKPGGGAAAMGPENDSPSSTKGWS